jgi:hypothetical protein
MFRRIWTAGVLLAIALGFVTAGPATGEIQSASTSNSESTTKPTTAEGHAKHRPIKDYAARILVILGAIYFATLLLLIFRPW